MLRVFCHLSLIATTLLVGGCIGSAAEHETLGDRHYASHRFGEALVEYRLELTQRPTDANLHAKIASSALRVGNLLAATEGYLNLIRDGGEGRYVEGADGLERVAWAAVESDDQEALAAALRALQQVAPTRALGSFAQELAQGVADAAPSEDALSLLTYAAAGATDARRADSLMFVYASVLRQLGRCEEAVPVYESLMRRQREPAILDRARSGVGYCGLLVAREFHGELQLLERAEEWYNRVIRRAGGTNYGRQAYLGLGDVLFGRGDYQGAAEAYESVVFGAPPSDSLRRIAEDRLRTLGSPGTEIP